jgi:hypothetical protein
MPTAYYPGLGATWFVALDAVGVRGVAMYAAFAVVAAPLLLMLLGMTLRSDTTILELFSVALIAPFFLAPYARPYDFPILLIPALAVLARLNDVSRLTFAIAVTLLPALHLLHLTATFVPPVVGIRRPEFTYFWIPMLIALMWLCYGSKGSREEALPQPAARG